MLTRKSMKHFVSLLYSSQVLYVELHTLHGSLCASSSQQTHRSNHEILKHPIGYLAAAGPVVCEGRDFVDVDIASRVFERCVEARGRCGLYRIGCVPSLGCIGSYEGGCRGSGEARWFRC